MFFFFNVLFEIFLFQNCFVYIFPIFNNIDEACTLLLLILTICALMNKFRKKALFSIEKKITWFMFIFMIIGALSTVIFKIQPEKSAIYKDAFNIIKFPVFYICALVLSNGLNKERLLTSVANRSRIYIMIIFIFSIINIFFEIGMNIDVRYGLRSYKFLFSHSTYLVSSMVIMMCVIIADQHKKSDLIFIIESIIILILTFRNKAFVFILAYFFEKLMLKYFKKIKLKYIFILGIFGILITYKKIVEVASYGIIAARPALYIVGFKLACDHFLFGSGFGTFASYLSGQYYSPVYDMYSISTVIGLTRDMYDYMADTFWPYIYGQFGFVGFVLFVAAIISIFISIKRRYYLNKKNMLAAFLMFSYILIASTAEAIFTDVTGIFIFMVMATYLGENRIYTKIKNDKNYDNNTIDTRRMI
ncbi:hypothetical protein [Clostridium saccharoperbutylacetonicum]|uniref:hypothetical protein n=1 Tax=Clostridium saccharoperbutylacetonicum TaxID=36745 RepID=UPI000983AAA5|nr:hypothetical protein [Clostridium saccharoperbutylacetonicum]AQR93884.1 hypothetical protein CLSAP_11910 [Clostridium saccharoperbutylacetonicum]NSB29582.1 hypothetical protein [Clostridium saccharoperbutylacetonicum]